MSELIRGKGRTHIKSRLMRESLVDKRVLAATHTDHEIAILPKVNIVTLGGHSIMDRGKSAVFPLIDEIARARKKHQLIVGVGGGARVRHTFHIALDLGLPLGGLSMVAGGAEEQNEKMLCALLAKHNGLPISKAEFLHLPLHLENGMIPIMVGMPPYHYWDHPSTFGRLPMNGPDVGMFMVAETLGARSLIYLKDEDGLFTADPKKDSTATFIPRIGAGELLRRDLPDLVIEREVLNLIQRAHHMKQVQVINGLVPGRLAAALDGKHVGTIIFQEKTA